MKTRSVFFGTTRFSVGILEALLSAGHIPSAIVTRPDRPRGRDLKLSPSPVGEFARQHLPDIPLFSPEKASTDSFCSVLSALSPDLFLVVAYGEIIKSNLLSVPSKACVNIHAGLLPEYRGAAPIQRCLMDGKEESGITFIEMTPQMDAGAILKQVKIPIPSDMNALQLEEALLSVSKEVLPEFLDHFDEYYRNKREQDETKVTFAPKISPEDCIIDWTLPCEQIRNRIRALSPRPGVFIQLRFGEEVKRLKILSSIANHRDSLPPGEWRVERDRIRIGCGEGVLEPVCVRLEGKKSMKIEEFLRGVSKTFSIL